MTVVFSVILTSALRKRLTLCLALVDSRPKRGEAEQLARVSRDKVIRFRCRPGLVRSRRVENHGKEHPHHRNSRNLMLTFCTSVSVRGSEACGCNCFLSLKPLHPLFILPLLRIRWATFFAVTITLITSSKPW
jgi:hypothetical protein